MSYIQGKTYRSKGKKVEVVGVDFLDVLPGAPGQNVEMVAYRYVEGSSVVYIRLASAVDFRPLNEVRVGDRIRYRDETRFGPDVKREVTYVSDLLVVYRVTSNNIKTKEYATRLDAFFNEFEIA